MDDWGSASHVLPFRLGVGRAEQGGFANNQVEDIRRGPAESSPEDVMQENEHDNC